MSTTVRIRARLRATGLCLAGVCVAATLALTGCSATSADPAPAPATKSITIGAQSGVTSQVIAHLYGEALGARGYTVSYNYGIGSRATFLQELQDGVIDVVPDYAGSLLEEVDARATATTTDDVMAQLPAPLKSLGLSVLAASSADKSRAYLTTREFASAHQLVAIGDIAPNASAITIGSSEDLGVGSVGREALSFSYGVTGYLFREEADDDSAIADLRDGTIQVADVSTLHLDAEADGLVELDDPRHIVVAQNVVPVLKSSIETSDLQGTLNAISAKLTTKDLAAFADVDSDSELPETTAHAWLEKHGLL